MPDGRFIVLLEGHGFRPGVAGGCAQRMFDVYPIDGRAKEVTLRPVAGTHDHQFRRRRAMRGAIKRPEGIFRKRESFAQFERRCLVVDPERDELHGVIFQSHNARQGVDNDTER